MSVEFIPKFWEINGPSREYSEAATLHIEQLQAASQQLGVLGAVAPVLAAIQRRDQPSVSKPTVLVFAADHGVCDEGVVDEQQLDTRTAFLQLANGHSVLSAAASSQAIDLQLFDVGVRGLAGDDERWASVRIADRTKNFVRESAMTMSEVNQAFAAADQLVAKLQKDGVNTIVPVCMALGGDASASMLASQMSNIQVDRFVDDPIDGDELLHYRKLTVLRKASERVQNVRGLRQDPMMLLAEFGGFEIAMTVGAMLSAAERGMTVVIDDFVSTVAFFVAKCINTQVLYYSIAAQRQLGHAHQVLLQKLSATPLISLGLSHCPGVGGVMAIPVLRAACALLALPPEARVSRGQQQTELILTDSDK